jgi:hypothetical protein
MVLRTNTRTDQLKGGTAQLKECTGWGSTDGRHGVYRQNESYLSHVGEVRGTVEKKDGTTHTRTDQLEGGTAAQLEECTRYGSTDGRHGVPAETSPTCPMLGR